MPVPTKMASNLAIFTTPLLDGPYPAQARTGSRYARSRSALMTTSKVDPSCRATAGPMPRPRMVAGTRKATTPRLTNTFCLITQRVLRLRPTANGRCDRLSAMSATSAVSRATSDPAAPMAIPTVAVAIAGASFTPSPTMATFVSARSWIMMNINTSEIMFAKQEKMQRQVASLTKIMTAHVVCDLLVRFGLDWNKVTINILTSSTTPHLGGTSAQLLPGDKISVRELMFAMMLPSGNDAAQSLAIYFGNLCLLQEKKQKLTNYSPNVCSKLT